MTIALVGVIVLRTDHESAPETNRKRARVFNVNPAKQTNSGVFTKFVVGCDISNIRA
jgi:hypothetical protein